MILAPASSHSSLAGQQYAYRPATFGSTSDEAAIVRPGVWCLSGVRRRFLAPFIVVGIYCADIRCTRGFSPMHMIEDRILPNPGSGSYTSPIRFCARIRTGGRYGPFGEGRTFSIHGVTACSPTLTLKRSKYFISNEKALEIHFVDRKHEIGGFFEELLTV